MEVRPGFVDVLSKSNSHYDELVMPLRCFVKIVMEVQINILPDHINILPDHINITQQKVNAKRLKFNYKVHPLVTL